MERKNQRKIEPLIPDTNGNTTPLKKPLSADDLASRSYREFMDRLNEARERERKEEESKKGNSSGQT
jgi:hypothetical protein